MEAFFSWVGAALGALFVVAVAVAWWEHLVRSSRPPAPPEAVVPRVVSVDVQLDALPDAAPAAPAARGAPGARGDPGALPPGDAAQRRATLDGAISRMVRVGNDGSSWAETGPMVLHSPAEVPMPMPMPILIPMPAPTTGGAAGAIGTPMPGTAPKPARA